LKNVTTLAAGATLQIERTQPPIAPVRPEGALGPYVRAFRAHRLLVAAITLLALAAAIGWLAHRSPQYQASAEILVNPLPQDNQTFIGIPDVLRDSPSDPTRTLQTAATFVDSPLAAQLAAKRVDHGYTLDSVQSAVSVDPQGQSNILAVSAKTDNAKISAQLANEFANAALQIRGQQLRGEIQAQLSQLQSRLRGVPANDPVTRGTIAAQINQLEAANNGKDPSLSLLQTARVPTSAVGAPPWLVIALSLLAGFMLAMGTALLMELLDRHVRDTEELLAIYPLPILARIPKLPRRLARGAQEISPLQMPPAVREGFRTLLVQLEQRPEPHRTLMVTSPTSRDGKTTSAINLAFALVGAGHKVILIDFDLRKPDVGPALGAKAERGLISLLAEDTKLADLLVPAAQLPPLKVVPAGTEGDIVLLEALTRRLPDLLKEAEQLADYVILDTAPLGEVSDALRIADQVDGIIVVTRPGHTNRTNFELMRDLLEQTGQTPLGYLVIGSMGGATSAYYTYGLPQRRDAAGKSRFARSAAR
jgi:capsular exopolysaccharide synthesis family protein